MRMKNSIPPRPRGAALGAPQPGGPSHEVTGEIRQLDYDHHTLVLDLDVPKPPVAFRIADDAEIVAGGRSDVGGGLHPGEHVTVRYTRDGERLTAQRIDFAPPAGTAKP